MGDVQIVQQRIELCVDLLAVQFAQFQDGADVLRDGQLAKDRCLLRQVGQPRRARRWIGVWVKFCVVQEQVAAVQRHQAHHHVKAGGFAGAVGSEQTDDFAAGNFQRDILDDGARLVAFLQPLRAEEAHAKARATGACPLARFGSLQRDAGFSRLGRWRHLRWLGLDDGMHPSGGWPLPVAADLPPPITWKNSVTALYEM